MTTRDFFKAVLDAHISEDMDTAATAYLQKLDDRNEKRKSVETKAKKEANIRRSDVLAFLKANKPQAFTRDGIAQALNISPAQASAACKALGDEIIKVEAKIDKARKMTYAAK